MAESMADNNIMDNKAELLQDDQKSNYLKSLEIIGEKQAKLIRSLGDLNISPATLNDVLHEVKNQPCCIPVKLENLVDVVEIISNVNNVEEELVTLGSDGNNKTQGYEQLNLGNFCETESKWMDKIENDMQSFVQSLRPFGEAGKSMADPVDVPLPTDLDLNLNDNESSTLNTFLHNDFLACSSPHT